MSYNYEILVKGRLEGPQWSDWFSGMTVTMAEGEKTALTGYLVDQAALYGLLEKIRDLGLPLVSVKQIDAQPG